MDKVTKHLSPLHLIQEEDAEISKIPLKTNCIIKKKKKKTLKKVKIYLLEKPPDRSKMRHFWTMPKGKGCFKIFILPL